MLSHPRAHNAVSPTPRISCEAVPPSVSPSGAQGGTSACSTGAALSFVSCIRVFDGSLIPSQVLWLQAGGLGDASEHLRTQLLAIVKGKGDIGPPLSRQRAVGTRLALDGPAYLEKRREHA